MANEYMRRCSTSLISRNTRIRTTMRCHLTPVRMAPIRKTRDDESWPALGEEGPFSVRCKWECKPVRPPLKTVWRLLRTLNTELPHTPAIPPRGLLSPKQMKSPP